MEKWTYLLMGGIPAGVCRYALAGIVFQKAGTVFSWGTTLVNCAFLSQRSFSEDTL